jgi:excisionase family DNA binding protein
MIMQSTLITVQDLQTVPNTTLFTITDVARFLRVDGTTVRRWIKNGVLPAIELPHANSRRIYRVTAGTLRTIVQDLPAE